MMHASLSATVLCIRETREAHGIFKSFPCGKKSRPLYYSSAGRHLLTWQPGKASLRITQTFRFLPGEEFLYLDCQKGSYCSKSMNEIRAKTLWKIRERCSWKKGAYEGKMIVFFMFEFSVTVYHAFFKKTKQNMFIVDCN